MNKTDAEQSNFSVHLEEDSKRFHRQLTSVSNPTLQRLRPRQATKGFFEKLDKLREHRSKKRTEGTVTKTAVPHSRGVALHERKVYKKARLKQKMEKLRKGKIFRNREIMLYKVFQYPQRARAAFRHVARSELEDDIVDTVKHLVESTVSSVGSVLFYTKDEDLGDYSGTTDEEDFHTGEENDWCRAQVNIPSVELRRGFTNYNVVNPPSASLESKSYSRTVAARKKKELKRQRRDNLSKLISQRNKDLAVNRRLNGLFDVFQFPKRARKDFSIVAEGEVIDDVVRTVKQLVKDTVISFGDTVFYHPNEDLADYSDECRSDGDYSDGIDYDVAGLGDSIGKSSVSSSLAYLGSAKRTRNTIVDIPSLSNQPKRARIGAKGVTSSGAASTSTINPIEAHIFADSPSRVIPSNRGLLSLSRDKENKSPPYKKRNHRTPVLTPPPKAKVLPIPNKTDSAIVTRSKVLDEIAEVKKQKEEIVKVNKALREKIKSLDTIIERKRREDIIKRRLMLGEIERQDEEVGNRQKVQDLALQKLRQETQETLKFVLSRAEEIENNTQKLRSDYTHLRLAPPRREGKKDEKKEEIEPVPSTSADPLDTTGHDSSNHSVVDPLNPVSISLLSDTDRPSTSTALVEEVNEDKTKKKKIRPPRPYKKAIRAPTPPRLARPNSKTNNLLKRQRPTPPNYLKDKEFSNENGNRFVVPQMTSLKTGNVVVSNELLGEKSGANVFSMSIDNDVSNHSMTESSNVVIDNASSTVIVTATPLPTPPMSISATSTVKNTSKMPKPKETTLPVLQISTTPKTSVSVNDQQPSTSRAHRPTSSPISRTQQPKRKEVGKEKSTVTSSALSNKRYLQMNSNDKQNSQSEFRNKIRDAFPNFTDEDLVDLIGESFPNLFNFDS